jgi:hypothetical protein
LPTDNKPSLQQLHLLGEIVVEFGTLELFLEVAIWKLLGSDDQKRNLMAQIVTAEMSFDRKIHAFVNMFKECNPGQAESELEELKKALFSVQSERNALMHSAWNCSETFGGLYRMKVSAKAADGFKRRIYPMSVERIEAVRSRIVAVGNSLARFAMEHIQKKDDERK